MTGQWVEQTAAAIIGVHLLLAVAVGAGVVGGSRLRKHWILWRQGIAVRVGLAMWLTKSSAPSAPEGGTATDGTAALDLVPSVALRRPRVTIGGPARHRLVA
jgi:hypothetical protein